MTDSEGRRNPRLRLACARCQRRKIRCDGQYPTCSNCRKASAECVDGDSARLRSGPNDRTADRVVINRLRRRVAGLESIIRERLPDVDLTIALSELSGTVHDEDSAATEQNFSPIQRDPQNSSAAILADVGSTIVPDQRAHEIGLVSVGFNADQKYIGPSSGYFLARLLLADSRRNGEEDQSGRRIVATPQTSINDLVSAIQGPLPLPPKDLAMQLCQVYFETIHPQYPILHEPSFRAALTRLYSNSDNDSDDESAAVHFQAYMVLAISASIWTWRTQRPIPVESYCLSALQYLDRIMIGSSLPGLQCMILLLIFTMHSPHMRVNVWYLNYQCIAAILDLGLQRQVTTSLGVSLLEQEMRTRIFWSVFTIDRTIASMMGRPIGLRDEACELRLLNDDDVIDEQNAPRAQGGNMPSSVHLFKIARLNSEIKYVANSIVRDVPSYAYPPIQDVVAWQASMLQQLDTWAEQIPESDNEYIRTTCELRYHSIRMLLLRPSPAIPSPGDEMLQHCQASARHSIRLYHRLYRQDLLLHDWITLHGIILSLVTILYCTRFVPDIAQSLEMEDLMRDVSIGLSILSATGEHWSGAKRAREIVDELFGSTMRWLKRNKRQHHRRNVGDEPLMTRSVQVIEEMGGPQAGLTMTGEGIDLSLPDISQGGQLEAGLFPDLHQLQDPFGDVVNLDDIMRNLFDDFIPRRDPFC
ncbi:hypothetical protein OPT61_g4578 [Boeremia exigua]|uniref:Uncharacterized protein n=1 Tax=Boeremia exigua TaxID=749465 RepID=A0ACC2IDI5_9PLEO|nr:hypothetical protein OPT61_g4578 [Boeremia exigua]